MECKGISITERTKWRRAEESHDFSHLERPWLIERENFIHPDNFKVMFYCNMWLTPNGLCIQYYIGVSEKPSPSVGWHERWPYSHQVKNCTITRYQWLPLIYKHMVIPAGPRMCMHRTNWMTGRYINIHPREKRERS